MTYTVFTADFSAGSAIRVQTDDSVELSAYEILSTFHLKISISKSLWISHGLFDFEFDPVHCKRSRTKGQRSRSQHNV